MSEGGYKIRNPAAIHFITFAVVEWVDVFTRKDYRDIVLESIKYCQAEKGLVLHSWCIMSHHLHIIVSAKNNDLSEILRDFKKFTSKQIILLSQVLLKSRKIIYIAVLRNITQQRNADCLIWSFYKTQPGHGLYCKPISALDKL